MMIKENDLVMVRGKIYEVEEVFPHQMLPNKLTLVQVDGRNITPKKIAELRGEAVGGTEVQTS